MAKVICSNEFKELVIDNGYIQNSSDNCIDGMKYDFRLGNSFLKAKFGQPMDFNQFTGESVESLFIQPGEVVFVLTEEILNLPNNMFVQLSEKRKMSHLGIITLGGFSVDPGYKGRLLFDSVPPEPIYEFSDDLIGMMKKFTPVSHDFINTRVMGLQNEIFKLREIMKSIKDMSGQRNSGKALRCTASKL